MGDDEEPGWFADAQSGVWPRATAAIVTRRRWRLDASGQMHRALTVFCPDRQRTCAVDVCAECRWNAGTAPDGHVECGAKASIVADRSSRRAAGECSSALAARVRVAVAVGDVVCVAHDLALARVVALPRCDMVVVVDEEVRPLGALFALDALRRAAPSARGTVGDRMSPVCVLFETEMLSSALLAMACDRLNRVCVVGSDGSAVGELSEERATSWLGAR